MPDLSLSEIEKILAGNRELIETVTTESNNWDLGILVHGPSEGHMYLLFYLRSRLDPAVIIYNTDLVKPYADQEIKNLQEKAIQFDNVTIVRPIQTILDKLKIMEPEFQAVKRLLDAKTVAELAALKITYDEFNELREQSSALADLGFEIKLQKSIRKIIPEKNTLKVVLSPIQQGTNISVFDYDVLAMIDSLPYSLEDLEELSKCMEPIIQLSTGYIEIKSIKNLTKIIEKISNAVKSMLPAEKLSLAQGNQLALKKPIRSMLESHDVEISTDFEFKFDQIVPIPTSKVEKILKGVKLFPYQIEGIKWMLSIAMRKMGGILADDMGMGKTIQTIGFISYLFKYQISDGPVLIVTPQHQSLLQWRDEIEEKSDLTVEDSYGADGRKSKLRDYLSSSIYPQIILTTIQTMKRDVDILKNIPWSGIIIDEAQIIKTPDSSQSSKFRALSKNVSNQQPIFRIALTGTPIENSLVDLWTIFDFIMPKYLPRVTDFRNQFGSKYKDLVKKPNRFVDLERLIFPFLLRRNKEDYLDLPDKNELKIYCTMSKIQVAMYTATVNSLKSELYEYKQQSDPKSLITRSSHIFSTLIRLKQICDHPFSQKELYNPKSIRITDSHKIITLLDLLEEINVKNEKVLIYTQYIKVGKILQKAILDRFDYKASFYNGSMSSPQRERVRKSFQSDSSKWILILSLKSGGVGLNLQAASHVIHFDRWYNPAIESQATDRAYRFGQKRNVTVYKLITKGTIEEKIDEILEDKEHLSGILNTRFREGQISQLNDKELMQLLIYKNNE